jgi:Bax protein
VVTKIKILLLLLLTASVIRAQQVTDDYIIKYSNLCMHLSDSFGIPAELILGVALVESAAGTSRNAKVLNNHFGIKSGNKLRNIKGIQTRFRNYESDSASFIDFCFYLKRRRFYTTLKGNFNYNAWINEMAKSGYSGSPQEWKVKIKTQILKHNLTELNTRNAASK